MSGFEPVTTGAVVLILAIATTAAQLAQRSARRRGGSGMRAWSATFALTCAVLGAAGWLLFGALGLRGR